MWACAPLMRRLEVLTDTYVLSQAARGERNYFLDWRPDCLPEGKFNQANSNSLRSVHICVGLSGVYHQGYKQVIQERENTAKRTVDPVFQWCLQKQSI